MSDVWGGSWIIDNVPAGPSCYILNDPNSDKRCGQPATTGRTALDLPVCEDCYQAVQALPERLATT